MTRRPAHRPSLPAVGTGLAGGAFSGLTGVGGGAVMVPLLTGVLRMDQHRAHGTSLVVIIFAAATGVATYAVAEGIDWALVGLLLTGSLGGAYLGARAVQRLHAMRLRQIFGVFLVVVALRLLLFATDDALLDVSGAVEAFAGAAIGLAGGFAAGALGVGGGAIFVPALVLLLGEGQHEAQGVSLAVILATAAVGAWTYRSRGQTDLAAASWIAVAAAPAGVAGAAMASLLGGGALQRVFAVVILGVGVHMAVSATRRLRHGSDPPLSTLTEAPPA